MGVSRLCSSLCSTMYAIISVLMVMWTISSGAFFTPNAYTLTGVTPINGSNADGECPSACVREPDTITVRRCDCVGTTSQGQITGVLIDNMVPTLDLLERDPVNNDIVWASQLFTVMGSTPNVTIGFRFQNSVVLREVELFLFHCRTWGIGAESIYVHGAGTFPNFVRTPSLVNRGSVTLTSNNNCASLIRVSIPLQMAFTVTPNYYIEFYNPSSTPIQWIHIAEVRFSDQPMAPTTTPTTEETTTTTGVLRSVTTEVSPTSTSPPNTADTTSTAQPPSTSSTPDTQSSSLAAIVGGLVGVILLLVILVTIGGLVIIGCFIQNKRKTYRTEIQQLQDVVLERNDAKLNKTDSLMTTTAENSHYQKTQFDIKARSQSSPGIALPEPPTPTGVTVISDTVYYSKLEKDATRHEAQASISEANYSDIPAMSVEAKLGMYDEIRDNEPDNNQYSTIDTINKKEKVLSEVKERESEVPDRLKPETKKDISYTLVMKKDSPAVPKKSPELYKDLEMEHDCAMMKTEQDEDYYTEVGEDLKKSLNSNEARNPVYISSNGAGTNTNTDAPAYYSSIKECKTTPLATPTGDDNIESGNPAYYSSVSENKKTTPVATPTDDKFSGDYSEIEADESLPENVYTEVKDNAHSAKRHITSGPVILSNKVCDEMEDNPNYKSSSAVPTPTTAAFDEDGIYTNPDALDTLDKNTSESVYETIYNEPILPSMFSKHDKSTEESQKDKAVNKGPEKAENTQEAEAEEEEEIYSPIYNLTSSMNNSSLQTVLQLTPKNICKVKTLGTGFFGKVILANTVGLSLKDLKMSDTDDDKTKSVRVAVKQLRFNPSPARKEAFEKELKFMSRLQHPNVVRTLGACTVDSPFIMMEYIEMGDLNQYLQDFDGITQGNSPPTELTISTGTLTNMCTQIADAMEYLASRNYIHRDLATRNCLVGMDSHIKISDFGMSRSLYSSHYYVIKGNAILPVRWMAKECFYGKFSAKTDVWAFGVTMWEIFTLAKEIPYEDMDATEVANDASKLDGSRKLLERPKDCPQSVYATMLMCWESEPSDRATFDRLHKALSSLDVQNKK